MDYTDATVFIKTHQIKKFAQSLTMAPIYDVQFTFVGLPSKKIEIRKAMENNGEDNIKALDELGLLGSQDLRPFMGTKLADNDYIIEDMAYYFMNSPNQFF